jgi:predicted ribosomally synthesized peptide with SipW-like signal peptide
MKKKLVLTLLVIGLLTFGVGMGTYAWFSAQVDVTQGEEVFEVGTMALEKVQMGDTPGDIFARINTQPMTFSQAWGEYVRDFRINNSGSLEVDIRPVIKNELVYNGAEKTLEELYEQYRIYVAIGTKDSTQPIFSDEKTALDFLKSSVSEYDNAYNDDFYSDQGEFVQFCCSIDDLQEKLKAAITDLDAKTLSEDAGLKIRIMPWLNYLADNEWQGVDLKSSFIFQGKQTNATWEDTYPDSAND